MRESVTVGEICLDGACGLVYRIGTMSYTVREDESYRYVFAPNWSVIDLLEAPSFQGVPGFDLALRKEEYIRENITPTFVSERAPAENREDLWQLLNACDMEYLNKLEWLIRTGTRYIGDGLYVQSPGKDSTCSKIEAAAVISAAVNSEHALRKMLGALSEGSDLLVAGAPLSRAERKKVHEILLSLLEKMSSQRERQRIAGVRSAAARGAYAGRKRRPIDELVLREAIERYEKHEIGSKEAADKLGVSEATFFRRLREFRSSSGA